MEPSVESGEKASTILIVEDDPDLLETYQLWLDERDDVSAIVKQRATEALTHLPEDVDGLVVDRELPGLSGPELLDRLDDSTVPVVVISAYSPDSHLGETQVAAYITKPVNRQEFLTVLASEL